jgi:hypothetical protein
LGAARVSDFLEKSGIEVPAFIHTHLLMQKSRYAATSTKIEENDTMTIDKLQPAPPQSLTVYMPYYKGNQRQVLPYAISLYKEGVLEGERKIEGGKSIPFVATWNVAALPADLTRCQMRFDGNTELSYEITMANFEFVTFLIDLLMTYRGSRAIDFSKSFYRKLLRLDE